MARTCGLILVLISSAVPAVGQSGHGELQALEFMAGCWTGNAGGETSIEETYTRPSRNIMLGTTRYIRDGTTTMFEFSLISSDSGVVALLPYPQGRASDDSFVLTHADDRRAVFEAPEHDYPKRIIYRKITDDLLEARIDGGAESDQVTEWRLSRVACPGS